MFETKIYYLGLILAVGGYAPSNKKTELLETTTSTWELLDDYPIDERDYQFYWVHIIMSELHSEKNALRRGTKIYSSKD